MFLRFSNKYKKALLERQMEKEIDEIDDNSGQEREATEHNEVTAVANYDETIRLVTDLRKCFGDHGITQSAQKDILALFRSRGFPDLPNSRVIMNSQSVSHLIQNCSNGQMYYFGHAFAVTILDFLLKALKNANLPLCKLIMLGCDGPNVYKSVIKKMNEAIKKEYPESTGLLDIGTCNLHVVNNAFKKALHVFSENVSEMLLDVSQ
ncbi:Universal stress protein [Frankliniella fusca]|uniref:Universal stress protein n=1 Tax=Frankliniella fusca TaxID=407009 RepID=A0AAE1LTF8_9NEOP|nr:Universal stress protein [Frankliniella fusca]